MRLAKEQRRPPRDYSPRCAAGCCFSRLWFFRRPLQRFTTASLPPTRTCRNRASSFAVLSGRHRAEDSARCLQGSGLPGFHRSVEDAYAVHDFMLSRDALRQLDSALGLRAAFSNPQIDRLSRFPSWLLDDSFEALHRYYQSRIELTLDASSGIATLRARAFAADDAVGINTLLLDAAEKLVNQLNERARKDLIAFASTEVEAAERRAKDAAVAVAQFRGNRGVVDPERQILESAAAGIQAAG